MKIYKVEYILRGISYAIRIEGARNIPDAAQAAEAILNKVYQLGADIRSVCEIYK